MFVLTTSKNIIFNRAYLGTKFLLFIFYFSSVSVSALTATSTTTTTTTTITLPAGVNSSTVVSQGLAIAAGHVISSREVKISYIIDQALAMPLDKEIADKAVESQSLTANNKKKDSVRGGSHASVKDQWLLANDSTDMQAHLAQVLVEIVVSSEAESFSIGQVDKDDFERWQKHLQEQTRNWSPWKNLEVQPDELSSILNRKMRAKNFLKFKMEASGVTVSEDEVKQYYEKNRVKFGNMPYAQFSQSIRDKLTQDQTQERLKDWFDILKRKYRVRLLNNQQSK